MNDPVKVRFKVSEVRSQHDAQRLRQLSFHSQHGAPTCVRHKPRPEKYFEKFSSNFSKTSNHFLFPTAISILSFNPSHVLQHGAQLRENHHPTIFLLSLHFFFLPNFNVPSFPIFQLAHVIELFNQHGAQTWLGPSPTPEHLSF